MIPLERRHKILEEVRKRGGVLATSELVKILNVSHMTVRRDLQKLEQEGLIVQVSGGVELSRKLNTEPSHSAKAAMCAEEKNRIGRTAASMIPRNSCIYLDAGTTSLAMCPYIEAREDLTIITNDFEVLNTLARNCKSTLIHLGGIVRAKNMSSVGPLAANTMSSLCVDVAFMSASSWDMRGITTPDIDKVTVKRAVIAASTKKILICDSSKFGQVATYLAFPLHDLDAVITDTGLPEAAVKAFEDTSIELHMV